jgi:hypothetical protein
VDTSSVAVAVPPPTKVMLVGMSDRAGPFRLFGEIVAERVMVPANPFRLVTLIAELADCPLMMLSDVGFALIEKVGVAEIVTFASRMFSGSTPPDTLGLVTVTQMPSLLVPEQPEGNSMKDPAVALTML